MLQLLARSLLRLMLRISTPPTRPWAEAMLAESTCVEGDWAALFWALGSAAVLLKRAVTDRLACPEELMQRPRILFSIGFTFLLLASAATALIAPQAWRAFMHFRSAEGTIASVESYAIPTAGRTAYSGTVHVRFQYGDVTYTPEIRGPVTVNPQVRDKWLRRYAVGAPYSFMFDPYAPDLPLGMAYPPFVRQIRIAFLASLGSLLISTAMVYVGKNKAI